MAGATDWHGSMCTGPLARSSVAEAQRVSRFGLAHELLGSFIRFSCSCSDRSLFV